jgi:hypothetical protein
MTVNVTLIRSFIIDPLLLIAGVPTFRALSPIMAYSISLYALVNTTTYFGVRAKIIPFFKKGDELEDIVYFVMLILVLVNFVCVPVLTWLDAPKAVQYLQKWKKFQVGTDGTDVAKYVVTNANVVGSPAVVGDWRGRSPSYGT